MGTLSLATLLVLFEKSRLWSGTGFHLLPSFHDHPTQHNYTTHTVALTSTSYNSIHYTDTRPTRNVVCTSGAWFENRPHSKPSIRHARIPKRVIVQWVGIGNNIYVLWIYTRSHNENSYLGMSQIAIITITTLTALTYSITIITISKTLTSPLCKCTSMRVTIYSETELK